MTEDEAVEITLGVWRERALVAEGKVEALKEALGEALDVIAYCEEWHDHPPVVKSA